MVGDLSTNRIVVNFVFPFKDRDQACDHSQSVAVFKPTLVHQDADKTTIRQNQSAISLLLVCK